MSYPCLYEQDAIYIAAGVRHIPEHDGVGVLCDAESCTVTQETDGTNELTLTYPCAGKYADKICPGVLIRVNLARLAVNGAPLQFYRVTSTEKRMDSSGEETIHVRAEHLSYDLKWHWCEPCSVQTNYLSVCISTMKAKALNRIDPFEYVVDGPADSVDSGSQQEFAFDEAFTKREGIMELQRLFGLCVEQDNLKVRFSKGGRKTGLILRKGKNLSEFSVYTDQAEAITGVYVYYKESNNSSTPRLVAPGDDPYTPAHFTVFNYAGKHPEGEFDEPTYTDIEQLVGEAFLRNRTHADPLKNYSAKIADMGDDIALYDLVTVEHPGFGVNTELEVTKIVYDVLRKRYTEIIAGGAEAGLAKSIAQIKNSVKG